MGNTHALIHAQLELQCCVQLRSVQCATKAVFVSGLCFAMVCVCSADRVISFYLMAWFRAKLSVGSIASMPCFSSCLNIVQPTL